MQSNNYEILQEIIGYKFIDVTNLITAFTHSSYKKDINTDTYERLEFFGDSILNFIVSSMLMHEYPGWDEGQLSKARKNIIREKNLANVAREYNLSKYIIVGKCGKSINLHENDSILADVFESTLGAIYLDCNDMNECIKFVNRFLKHCFDMDFFIKTEDNYKSKLQELILKYNPETTIEYKVLEEIGPDHKKEFKCGVYINSHLFGQGIGYTKKKAEQDAAKNTINDLIKVK